MSGAGHRDSAASEAATKQRLSETLTDDDVHQIHRWISTRRHIELTLYGSVTLLALILGMRVDDTIRTPATLIAALWATSIGLAIAHWFASSIAGRVSSPERLPIGHYANALFQSYPLLFGSAFGTLGALIGAYPDGDFSRAAQGADIMLTALCGAVAWGGATAHGAPIRRRLTLSFAVVVFASAIAGMKFILGH
jgi:hypothetical protein